MSKLDELINEYCPNGVEYKKLGDIAHYSTVRIDTSSIDTTNYVGVENLLPNKQGKILATSIPTTGNVIEFKSGDVLIGNIRPYLRKIWLANCNGGTNGDVLTIQINSRSQILPDFLYYILSSEAFFNYDNQNSKGAKMPRGDKLAILKYAVPVPPLPVQEEIVRILDSFTSLTAELQDKLNTEFQARRKQYEYYASNLFDKASIEWKSMGDIASFVYGYTDKAQDTGDTRFIRITDIDEQGHLKNEEPKYITINNEAKKSLLSYGDLIMARTGATYGKTLYFESEFPSVYASFLIKIIPNKNIILNKYYWHFTRTSFYWEQANRLVTTGGQPQFNTPAIKQIKIPVPSIDVQKQIINILDKFDSLINDLTTGLPAEIAARQKQYEYYRDKLLTFKELS